MKGRWKCVGGKLRWKGKSGRMEGILAEKRERGNESREDGWMEGRKEGKRERKIKSYGRQNINWEEVIDCWKI